MKEINYVQQNPGKMLAEMQKSEHSNECDLNKLGERFVNTPLQCIVISFLLGVQLLKLIPKMFLKE